MEPQSSPILVANAGSSSLKLSIVDAAGERLAAVEAPAPGGRFDEAVIERFLSGAPAHDAAGHRFVHGGSEFRSATLVDADAVERMRGLVELAPLHNAPALASLELLRSLRPELPQVACFDTAFHATLPDAAATYAVPPRWREELGIRRFGFHGLSHGWAAERTAELLGRPLQGLRMVTCHLGAGASLAAVDGGRSVDTTMGFTPLEGLVMATRSGSVDPGALLHAQRQLSLTPAELENAIEREAGLAGLAGTPDMRKVVAAAAAGEARAVLALAVYVHRLRAGIAAMAAAMNGLDALVFTAGVGEGSAKVRAAACAGLGFLGVELDEARNSSFAGGDADVTAPGARVATVIVHAREDVRIAAETRAVLRGG